MDDSLDSNLGDVAEVEKHVCDHSQPEENRGCCEEQDRVEVCLLRGLGSCDSQRLQHDVLGRSA